MSFFFFTPPVSMYVSYTSFRFNGYHIVPRAPLGFTFVWAVGDGKKEEPREKSLGSLRGELWAGCFGLSATRSYKSLPSWLSVVTVLPLGCALGLQSQLL